MPKRYEREWLPPSSASKKRRRVSSKSQSQSHSQSDANAVPQPPPSKQRRSKRLRKKTEYKYGMSSLHSMIRAIEKSSLCEHVTLPYDLCRNISEFAMIPRRITIHVDSSSSSMLLYISRQVCVRPSVGDFSLTNLFIDDPCRVYCTEVNTGNCVDLLLDLGAEHTLCEFLASSPLRPTYDTYQGSAFTCPVKLAYLWVFGGRERLSLSSQEHDDDSQRIVDCFVERTVGEIRKLVEPLCTYGRMVDLNETERNIHVMPLSSSLRTSKRNEMIAVACFKDWTEERIELPANVRGRFVFVKLLSDINIGTEDTNVDAEYIGFRGYKN